MLTVLCPDSLADSPDLTQAQSQLVSRLRFARRNDQHLTTDEHARVTPIEHWLAQQFDLPANAMVGAYSRFSEAAPEPGRSDCSLTIAPAHLHAGRDHLVLQPITTMMPTETEASELIAAANAFFKDDGIALEMVTPQTWLLHTPTRFDVALSSSAMATGRSVEIYMPAGKDGRRLRALLNELQMLWHEHPVNLARDETQLPRINTVWAEGVALPLKPISIYQRVITDDAALRGLARASKLDTHTITDADKSMFADPKTLMQIDGGAEAALQCLDQHGDHPIAFVLASALQWVALTVKPTDRLRRWRRNPLRQ